MRRQLTTRGGNLVKPLQTMTHAYIHILLRYLRVRQQTRIADMTRNVLLRGPQANVDYLLLSTLLSVIIRPILYAISRSSVRKIQT